jgi:hypothetical protein
MSDRAQLRPFRNRSLRESDLLVVLCPGVLDDSLKTQCSYCLGDLRRILSRCYIRAGWDDRQKNVLDDVPRATI